MSCDSVIIEPAEEEYCRKQVLRDAVICVAWLKLTTVICYILIFYFVRNNSKGDVSMAIQILLLIAIIVQIILGIILFVGAVNKQPLALDIALWFCLALASHNTVLGVLGAIYFIRVGDSTIHFLLVVTFSLIAVAFFVVLCHDILVIYGYKQMLLTFPEIDLTLDCSNTSNA